LKEEGVEGPRPRAQFAPALMREHFSVGQQRSVRACERTVH
jgi:hypothetical protein